MQRNEARAARLGRRPLRLLSNAHNNGGNSNGLRNDGGKRSSKPRSGKKLFSSSSVKMTEGKGRAEGAGDDDILDRLLLVQSDLSNLTRQIDEIVVQAFKLDEMSKMGKKEVWCFTSFLSEMLSSLKQWAPRLQKALLDSPEESEKLMALSPLGTDSGTGDLAGDDDNNENISVSSPDQIKLDSLISPSPLVSWHANCTVERGRQVFLLTPLPISKALSSKFQESSKLILKKIASATASVPSLQAFFEKTDGDILKDGEEHSTSNQPSKKPGFVSPLTLPRKDYSLLMMTPCIKVSPPKSCALLEPASESVQWKNCNARKSTPFPVRLSSELGELSESSGSEASDDLATKYPELLGIRQAQKLGIGKKERESSPDWFFSPPKSCILMEPPDGNHVNVAANTEPLVNGEADILVSQVIWTHDSNRRTQKQEPSVRSLALIESTPVWKDRQSTVRKGKRPGETTLKKELWTRFEAASCGFRLKGCGGLDLEKKGFLDRLDEVSLDEKTP